MRAVLVEELGVTPTSGDVSEPVAAAGEALVELQAASLNPADIAIAGGSFYAGHPDLPYVPALEGVGTVIEGRSAGSLVYAAGGGLGVVRDGTAAERFTIPEEMLIELPADTDPATAAALGVAGLAGWLPVSWRAKVQPGEIVLVLGATGSAGRVAMQAARALGAGRVIGAGRTRERLEQVASLADATVWLGTENLADELTAACNPGPNVVIDLVWGEPLEAAVAAAPPAARFIQIGQSAGPLATLPSAAVRGKQLEILGYSNFVVPREETVATYLQLVSLATAGELVLEVHAVPMTEVERAWEGVRSGGVKYAVVP